MWEESLRIFFADTRAYRRQLLSWTRYFTAGKTICDTRPSAGACPRDPVAMTANFFADWELYCGK